MIYILHRPESEHARAVEEFTHNLDELRVIYELVDVDSREGTAKAELYGPLQYPAVLAIKEDGSLMQSWAGLLPPVDQVGYFSNL